MRARRPKNLTPVPLELWDGGLWWVQGLDPKTGKFLRRNSQQRCGIFDLFLNYFSVWGVLGVAGTESRSSMASESWQGSWGGRQFL